MNKKLIIKIAVAIVVIAAVCFGGYKYWSNQQAQKTNTTGDTYTVKRMDLKSVVSATGTIKPVTSVEVSSKITARIKTVLVKENDTVTSGQTVATLDGKDYENELIKSQETVSNDLSKYNRAKYLYSIGAESQADLEDAQYNYESAESDMEVSKSNLAETVITAPIDGIVVGEPKTPGTMAVQGNNSPTVIMRIADLSQKQILAKIDETDIGNIQVGQSATFTVDAYTNKNFTGKVAKISQTDISNSWDVSSDSTSSSSSSSSSSSVIYYYVTLDVDDTDGLLKPGMTARVEVNTSNKSDAIAVPLSALKTDSNGSYVVVVKADGSTENRYVKTGIYSDDYVEITDGLDEGENIALTYTAKESSSSSSSSSKKNQGGPPL